MFPQPYFRDKKSLSPKEIASIASLVNIQLLPYFQRIGLNPRQSGFHYLRDAVVEYLIATVEVGITKVIYPNVAEARSTTAGAVERAMRYTIDTAWDEGLLKDSGGGVFPVFHEKPANKNFIVALAVDRPAVHARAARPRPVYYYIIGKAAACKNRRRRFFARKSSCAPGKRGQELCFMRFTCSFHRNA